MTVEVPSTGRATVTDTPQGMEITIPAKRSPMQITFKGLFLIVWAFALVMVSRQTSRAPQEIKTAWMVLWIIAGLLTLWSLMWHIVGREVVTLNGRTIRIKRRPWIPRGEREFALNDASNFRVSPDPVSSSYRGMRGLGDFPSMSAGTIKFDYGMKTVAFGVGLDEAEAAYLIKAIRDRGYIRAERTMSS